MFFYLNPPSSWIVKIFFDFSHQLARAFSLVQCLPILHSLPISIIDLKSVKQWNYALWDDLSETKICFKLENAASTKNTRGPDVLLKFQFPTFMTRFQRHNPRGKRVGRAWADRHAICIIQVIKQLSRSATNSELLFLGRHSTVTYRAYGSREFRQAFKIFEWLFYSIYFQ